MGYWKIFANGINVKIGSEKSQVHKILLAGKSFLVNFSNIFGCDTFVEKNNLLFITVCM